MTRRHFRALRFRAGRCEHVTDSPFHHGNRAANLTTVVFVARPPPPLPPTTPSLFHFGIQQRALASVFLEGKKKNWLHFHEDYASAAT